MAEGTLSEKNQRDNQRDIKVVPINSRIISYLHSISPRPATPKEVAFEIHAEHETVKKALKRLTIKGTISQSIRGYYRVFYSLDDILRSEAPEMRLHGIKIEGDIPQEHTGIHSCPLIPPNHPGGRTPIKHSFDGRVVTVFLAEGGHLEIYLRSSRYPLSFTDFERFAGWLDAMSGGHALEWGLTVVQLGLGRDFREYRLDGIKSIKWGQWRNAWAQIYQKSQTLRAEIHIQERIGLGDAIHILNGMCIDRAIKEMPEPKDMFR